MNQKPFQFGVPVDAEHFIGREEEQKRLEANFKYGINTILLSPRRWGKTSLVNRVAEKVNSETVVIVKIDAFSCRSEYDFYNLFSAALLKQTASRIEDWMNQAKGFIERLTPKITLSQEIGPEFSISLGITPKTHSPEEVLNLPEMIAERKGCHIIVCIDEFQQIGEFENSLTVQKRMRTVWQNQKNVSYCLYGSKLHMMTNFFLKRSYPFFKFGDIIYLKNIPTETWIPYIKERFRNMGKTISDEHIATICNTVENQSSYVQQLAWNVLLNTEDSVSDEIIRKSVEDLIDHNAQVFIQQTQGLTSYQLNFLKALLDGIKDGFTKVEILDRYNLGTASNITRLKTAMIEKELIEQEAEGLKIGDPVLRMWLKKNLL